MSAIIRWMRTTTWMDEWFIRMDEWFIRMDESTKYWTSFTMGWVRIGT